MKNMRYIKNILLTALLVNVFFACENVDFGDTNDNPNGATSPATSGLFSGAIMNLAQQTNRAGITIPTLMVQYQAQVTYTDEMLYSQTPYSWAAYYTGMILPLNRIIEITSDPATTTPEVLLQGSAANQKATALIFRAIVMKRVTDVWGDAPWTEAGKGIGDVTPAYDTQESIYLALIADLKAARDMIVTSEKAPTGDILYKGNMANWQKLANSVLIQIGLTLSEVNPTLGEATFDEALASPLGVIDDVAEEAWFSYADLTGFRNPWNANRTADYFATKEFTDAMYGNVGAGSLNPTSNHTNDTRAKVYLRLANTAGVPYGYRDGSGAGKNQMNRNYYWNATSPLPLMTASYTYLNRAEAAALGWSAETAATLLSSGITKSFETLETHSKASPTKPAGEVIIADAAAYAAARVTDAGTVGMLQVIREEKWKSLFGQAFDAWAEWKRTGTPTLVPATDYYNDGQIPVRYIYPREEATLNGSNYDAAVGRQGGDDNTTHVWWDVD
jgi:hypothetical protein